VSPFSTTTETIEAFIGGAVAKVGYAGLAPGLAGLYQLNITIPATGITAGDYTIDVSGSDSYAAQAIITIGTAPTAAELARRQHSRPKSARQNLADNLSCGAGDLVTCGSIISFLTWEGRIQMRITHLGLVIVLAAAAASGQARGGRGGRGGEAPQQTQTPAPQNPDRDSTRRAGRKEFRDATQGPRRWPGHQLHRHRRELRHQSRRRNAEGQHLLRLLCQGRRRRHHPPPVSFIYNGGPGSASMYTHMGLGPKRIKLTDDGHGMPAPYEIEENGDSFLDATDMVFVDAPDHRLQPRGARRECVAVLRRDAGRDRLRRFHLPVHYR
jgi:hypothetical protein